MKRVSKVIILEKELVSYYNDDRDVILQDYIDFYPIFIKIEGLNSMKIT